MKYKEIDTSKLNYVVYCRKSSEDEERQVQSLETQFRELQEHASKNQLNIVEVISEKKSAFKIGREGFERMLSLIRSGKANAILVIRANRISRNPIDAGQVISLMDDKKILFIRTPNSTCYTCSSTDKMMIALELIFSKKDSDDKGDMVREGQKTRALKGMPHGVATLGFLNDRSEEKGNRRWFVDKPRFDAISILFQEFLTGTYSAGKLHKYAVDVLKLTTVKRKRCGGELIMLSRIYTILKDPVYAGFFFYDNVRHELDPSLPRIITEEQHEKVKMLLSKKNIPKVQKHRGAYSGFITSDTGDFIGQDVKYQLICDCKKKFAYRGKELCPCCGSDLEQLRNPKYLSYTFYYNVRKKRSKQQYKSITEDKVSDKLAVFFDENLNFSSDLVEWSKKYIHEMKDNEIVRDAVISGRKAERKNELQEKRAKTRAMLRDEKITQEEYAEDIERLEREYADVSAQKTDKVDWYARLMEITDITASVSKVLKGDDVAPKRNILSSLGSNLIWNDKELKIINTKEVDALIEGIKRVKAKYPKFEPKNYRLNKGSKEKTEPKDPVFSSLLRG